MVAMKRLKRNYICIINKFDYFKTILMAVTCLRLSRMSGCRARRRFTAVARNAQCPRDRSLGQKRRAAITPRERTRVSESTNTSRVEHRGFPPVLKKKKRSI